MASPELRIMSSAPRARPLSNWARFTWSSVAVEGGTEDPGTAHGWAAPGARSVPSVLRLGGLAGRVRLWLDRVAVRRGHDLPAQPGALLDDLADVRGPHQLAVAVDLHLALDGVEAEAGKRRLDLRGVDALGLLDRLEEHLRGDVVVGLHVVRRGAVRLLPPVDERLVQRAARADVVAEVVVEAHDLVAQRLEQRLRDHVEPEDGLVLVEQLEL